VTYHEKWRKIMNAKSKLLVKYAEGVIEMNTTFAKEMRNPLSEEYALLQRTRLDFPTFAVRTRQIKSNPHKDTYKGLTYEWMRNHIATHEPKNVVEEKLNAFDEMVYISKCHRGSLRYPTIKKWFLNEYPDVAKFGTIEAPAEAQAEETKSQNVIPMPEVQTEVQPELKTA
jgi:hypothetical protein